MPRTAVNAQLDTRDIKVTQKPDIILDDDFDPNDREPEIVEAGEDVLKKDYADALAFAEEPMTIRIEPSTDKNAATVHPVWCNGKGAEVLIRGRWREVTWLPVNTDLIVKRKYVAILCSAKIDQVLTTVVERPGDDPENRVQRITTPVLTFSVIEDKNPRGHAWLTGLRQRNA